MLEKVTDYSKGKTAAYTYNGIGQRVGQEIYAGENLQPEEKIEYILDLTRSYNNLLVRKEDGRSQTYLWDSNVIGAISKAEQSNTDTSRLENCNYYLQDELGSIINYLDPEGESIRAYSYDEFGIQKTSIDTNASTGITTSIPQPFGYTGYQKEEVGEVYYAQSRRYDAGVGRFISKDLDRYIHPENAMTINQYNYCMLFVSCSTNISDETLETVSVLTLYTSVSLFVIILELLE